MKVAHQELLSGLPKVDNVLKLPKVVSMAEEYSYEELLISIRQSLGEIRSAIIAGSLTSIPSLEGGQLIEAIRTHLQKNASRNLVPVINATGIILHTNLGRAPLSESAIEAINHVARGYSNLEFQLDAGKRGSRHSHVEHLITHLIGAEAALVVNNCAAGVLVSLAALTAHGPNDVIISRGELIEIGGSFRIPNIIAASGANMVEVGTTNRTHLSDYESAVGVNSKVLMSTHSSNFQIQGFTAKPALQDLSNLAKRNSLVLFEDLGSGLLASLEEPLSIDEPTPKQSLLAGVDVVTFSADKLLGGPQAGIIAGKKEFIDTIRRHPMMRAVRIDKLCLAALEETLRAYGPGRDPTVEIPVLQRMHMTSRDIRIRAEAVVKRLAGITNTDVSCVAGVSFAGGGTLPTVELATTLIQLSVSGFSAKELELALRMSDRPVIGRISNNCFLIDLRTVSREEEVLLVEEICKVAKC